MKLQNIDRLLLIRHGVKGCELTLEELQTDYGFEPDGTNFYYGINPTNLTAFQKNGAALDPDRHQNFFKDLLASLDASKQDEKTVVIGVEPPESPENDPYGFVSKNMPLVTKLATELASIQADALDAGKRLLIAIRYASEMNAGDQRTTAWRYPAGYKSTFVQVRTAFAQAAPNISFSFSPALRADIDESQIARFWPGDQYVDIIGGTWYTGSNADLAASTATMRAYFLHRVGAGKPFALSELGGCNPGPSEGVGVDNDKQLARLLHELEGLQLHNVPFKYVTIFLDGKWGSDATLSFLAGTNE